MERSILYRKKRFADTELEYHIITEDIARAYCDLKYYGARIIKTVRHAGGKTAESAQINNIFYRRADAEEFIGRLAASGAEPSELRRAAEKCRADSIKKAGKTA